MATHKNKAPLVSEAMLDMSLPPFFAYYIGKANIYKTKPHSLVGRCKI
jgi:hypothetical protein